MESPYNRVRVMMAAIAAAFTMPAHLQAPELAKVGTYRSRGHGGRYKARHAGSRKVAWDKRDARKRRNRLRAKRR